jgi:fucose 4-O-acetylase-like acetyltransferase
MKRDKSIDAVAGLMIIVMVIGHCVAVGYLKHFINVLNFFMPWFYYKSGMFYRRQSNWECIVGGGQEITVALC